MKLYRFLPLCLIIFLLLLAAGCAGFGNRPLTDAGDLRQGIKVGAADRVLVVAPHPDDESLGAAGIVQIAKARGAQVKVVVMTSGDAYRRAAQTAYNVTNPGPADYQRLGNQRHLESIAAMTGIGLNRKDLVFLGYPDGGMDALFTKNWDYNRLHLAANGSRRSPYRFAYEPNAPYCGANVVKNLTSIIKDFQPTAIVFPGAEDVNHDHWATNAFVEYALTEMRYRCRSLTYLVHRGKTWPSPTYYAPRDSLLPPAQLTDAEAIWFKVPLSAKQESKKELAIDSYKTQLRLTEAYLEAFTRKNELFAVYPDIVVSPSPVDPPFFATDVMYGRILLDPRNDTFVNNLSGYGDLLGVSFAYDKDKTWFTLDTTDGISPGVVYAYHLRIFKKDKSVSRIDALVINGKTSYPRPAKNNLDLRYTTRLRQKGNRMVLEMPGAILRDVDYVMVSADTYTSLESKWIDRTGWRRLVVR
jgi:N-acetyl-1-D-myo-inositol-2-amino-2-deoxy-alpha-D-glucopyranoside deacetylase